MKIKLPVPKEGDIVGCPANGLQVTLGKIRCSFQTHLKCGMLI